MKHYLSLCLGLTALLFSASCQKDEPKQTEYDDAMSWKGKTSYTVTGAGETIKANLNTNVDYSVKISYEGTEKDWITYNAPTKNSNPAVDVPLEFVVAPFAYSKHDNRTAIISITSKGMKDQGFVVIQTPTTQLRLKVTPDVTRFTNEGGVMTVDIDASSSYTTDINVDWITPVGELPTSGSATVQFAIAANTFASDRDGTVTFTTTDLEPQVITVHQDAWTSNIGISSVADLLEFIEATNVGDYETHDLSKWVNENGEICLLKDLDLSSVSEWTPISNPTDLTLVTDYCMSSDTVRVFGPRYNSGLGIFNGNNHVISNLHMKATGSTSWMGFFGMIYGATIKNLIFDETCTLEVNTTADAGCAYGFVAGAAVASTIENVTVKGTIKKSQRNHVDYTRVFAGGLVGNAFACGTWQGDMIIKNCEFDGKCEGFVSNTVAGTTPHTFGGLVGFANLQTTITEAYPQGDPTGTKRVKIINCTNKTDITGNVMKMGGILGWAENGVVLDGCKNYGSVSLNAYDLNNGTATDKGRVGGLVAYENSKNAENEITNCENYGNVISLDGKSVAGGFISVIAGSKGTFSDNKADCTVACPAATTRGMFAGNVNTVSAKLSGNLFKGYMAESYMDGEFMDKVQITKENADTYKGKNAKDNPEYATGISFWE